MLAEETDGAHSAVEGNNGPVCDLAPAPFASWRLF